MEVVKTEAQAREFFLMCGIAGMICPGLAGRQLEPLAAAMAATLAARGPDGAGTWADDGIALGHRRLAVLDLSPAGAQPMRSADGRCVLAFNGEIYNHAELRAAFPGQRWRGHGDAESLLTALAEALAGAASLTRATEAFAAVLGKTRGMFAGALWERPARRLWLFRDRLGEKPLYYGAFPLRGEDGAPRPAVVFASEMKAFRALPGPRPAVSRAALAQLVERGCCHDCVWEGFHKLPPGGLLCLTDAAPGGALPPPGRWWSAAAAARAAWERPFAGTAAEAADELERLLRSSVREQLAADVPVGVLLSGGVDSATLAALATAEGGAVETFALGFADPRYDEAPAAAAIARHLGTRHHEERLGAADALALVDHLPRLWDEPFADSSQIPTWFVCRAARRQVTVAIGGDGGDEGFGGYDRHRACDLVWPRWGRLPRDCRRAAATLLSLLPPRLGNLLGDLDRPRHPRHCGDKFLRLARAMGAADFAGFYAGLTGGGARLVLGAPPAALAAARFAAVLAACGPVPAPSAHAALLDFAEYLPDDLLAKTDRAAMSQGLETRAPFLDPRVVAFAMSLPQAMKFRRVPDGAANKWLLRQVAARHLPPALLSPRKKGFGAPVASWLRGELREWAGDLLAPASLRAGGWFDAGAVARLWAAHQSGRRDHAATLWSVLAFLAWEREWRGK